MWNQRGYRSYTRAKSVLTGALNDSIELQQTGLRWNHLPLHRNRQNRTITRLRMQSCVIWAPCEDSH